MFGLLLALAIDPCTVLPELDVRQIFEVPAATPVRQVRADSCTYMWMGLPPSTAELRDALRNGRKRPSRDSESVSLRIEPLAKPVAEIEARFEKLAKGYAVERDGEQRTVKPQRIAWVNGLGEKAYWNASLSQLVVARKDALISVVVKRVVAKPEDLANLAQTIAQSVLRKQ